MNDKQIQQAFVKWFSQKAQQAGKDPQAMAQELGEEGMKQAYQMFVKEMQGKGMKAMLGAKLEYIQHLTAPKFACGGKAKKVKKMEEGEQLNEVQKFKKKRKKF